MPSEKSQSEMKPTRIQLRGSTRWVEIGKSFFFNPLLLPYLLPSTYFQMTLSLSHRTLLCRLVSRT